MIPLPDSSMYSFSNTAHKSHTLSNLSDLSFNSHSYLPLSLSPPLSLSNVYLHSSQYPSIQLSLSYSFLIQFTYLLYFLSSTFTYTFQSFQIHFIQYSNTQLNAFCKSTSLPIYQINSNHLFILNHFFFNTFITIPI